MQAVVPAASTAGAAVSLTTLNAKLLASGALKFQAGVANIANTLGSIFKIPFSHTLSGLQAGLQSIVAGSATLVFGGISVAASALAEAVAGAPILGTVTLTIAKGAGAFATYISTAPVLIQVAAVVAVAYVAVKVVEVIWDGLKRWLSDERTKTNVKFVRKMPNGLNLYQYEYKKQFKDIAGHGVFEGYMAQEVEKRYPKAVQIENNGYKSINYSLIGI